MRQILCYNDFKLKYAKFDGINWIFSTPDSNTITSAKLGHVSIDVNSDNIPSIAYLAGNAEGVPGAVAKIKFAEYNLITGWTNELIIDGNYDSVSLAIDSNDIPHISYHKMSPDELGYATKPSFP